MKEAIERNYPVLHISWVYWSISFRSHMNYRTFDILNSTVKFSNVDEVMDGIFKLEDANKSEIETNFENMLLECALELNNNSEMKNDNDNKQSNGLKRVKDK